MPESDMTGLNPFATVGHPVFGDAHVGRAMQVRTVEQRVLELATAGATAIIGPPRIGKSSLAYHAFMRPEARTRYPNLLPVWMNVRTQGRIERVLHGLVDEVWEMIVAGEDPPSPRLARSYERASDRGVPWLEAQLEIQDFLKLVRRQGKRVVLVLDEFDAAREVFKSQPGAFQILRELAYNIDWNIGLVTTSRRQLREIVDMADPDESTFAGIFRTLFLTCFDEAELAELVALVPGAGAEEQAEVVRRLREVTGGHPFLASVLLDRVCSSACRAGDFTAALEEHIHPLPAEFLYYYSDLEELLRAEGRLRHLLEIVLGPQLVATLEDAQALLQQGLIVVRDGRYRAFSENFQNHLVLVGRGLSHWDNWMTIERRVRDVIEAAFAERYGEDWCTALREKRPKLSTLLDQCEQLRARELRVFGPDASTRLIDFTYPQDLYILMSSHWDTFGRILGKDKSYWNERFSLLSKVRNPMVHNRMSVVTPVEQRLFTVYCDELMELLDRHAEAADT